MSLPVTCFKRLALPFLPVDTFNSETFAKYWSCNESTHIRLIDIDTSNKRFECEMKPIIIVTMWQAYHDEFDLNKLIDKIDRMYFSQKVKKNSESVSDRVLMLHPMYMVELVSDETWIAIVQRLSHRWKVNWCIRHCIVDILFRHHL